MKTMMFVAALVFTAAANAQDKKEPEPSKETPIDCSLEHLPQSWKLKVKSSTSKETLKDSLGEKKFTPPKAFSEIRMTLEFAETPAQVKEIRKYVVTEDKLPKPGDPAFKDPKVQLFLFDADKVLLGKLNLHEVTGEITGVKGDAFRIASYCEAELFKKVKKIELRPVFSDK